MSLKFKGKYPPNFWSAPKSYWMMQALGWSGMIALETINYTFFIIGSFSFDYFFSFLMFAAAGIVVSHTLRFIVHRYNIFQKSNWVIWSVAPLAVLICSVVAMLLMYIPPLFIDINEVLNSVDLIYFMGLILNNARYFLIWVAIYFLYEVLEHRNELTQARYDSYQRAKNFELALLRKQINPHFLFNALNSIKALVLIDPETCRSAAVELSELLRYTINSTEQDLVTVGDEIEEVKKYLNLEKLRFQHRLELAFKVDEQILNEFIPPATILTLAENAIKHGVAKNSGISTVRLIGETNSEGFRIGISNSGNIFKKDSGGIGLRYVKLKLEEHFDDHAVFKLEEVDGEVNAWIDITTNGPKNRIDRRRTTGISRAESLTEGA